MDNVIKISDHFWIIEEDGVRSFLFEGDERAITQCQSVWKPVYALCFFVKEGGGPFNNSCSIRKREKEVRKR